MNPRGRSLASRLAWPALACGVFGLSLGGCEGPATEWLGTRDTIDGVVVVRNPGEPLLDRASIRVRELWRQAGGSGDDLWERPTHVAVGADRVLVLDRQAHRVHVLDARSGDPLVILGSEGGGPGEFQRPFGVEIVGDTIVVGDGGGPGLDLFSMDGGYARSLRLGFLPFLVEDLPDGRLWVTGLGEGTSEQRVVHLGGETLPFTAPDTSSVDPQLVFDDCPRWGPSREGLVRGHCRRLAYEVLTSSGTPVAEVHVDRPPVLATEAELDTLRRRMRRMVTRANLPPAQASAFVEERLREAAVKAVYVRIRGERATGRSFVQEQSPPNLGSRPATLHVFAADGRYLALLSFERAWSDFDVVDGRLYALTEQRETGLAELVAYELQIPESL